VLYNKEKDYIVLKYSMNEGYTRNERINKWEIKKLKNLWKN
jgi:hypothetical protein